MTIHSVAAARVRTISGRTLRRLLGTQRYGLRASARLQAWLLYTWWDGTLAYVVLF